MNSAKNAAQRCKKPVKLSWKKVQFSVKVKDLDALCFCSGRK
jgi:hypothetical protein